MLSFNNFRLSVIIPGYNTPQWMWDRCIKSVLNTIGPEDEIICVNDGSQEYPQIIDDLAKSDARIKIIHKENGGLSSARNVAISVAKGRFISFVDSDDEVVNGIYDESISYMEETDSDICLFGVQVIWTDAKLYKHDTVSKQFFGKLTPSSLQLLHNKKLFNYVWNKVYRKECFFKLNGSVTENWFDPEGMPCEDLIFNLSLVMSDVKWCSLDSIGYIYYRTDGTLLSTYKSSNTQGIVNAAKIWKKYCEYDECAKEFFSTYSEISESKIYASEWSNIWMPKSPYSIRDKYKWLCKNKGKFTRGFSVYIFLKKLIQTILRRYFYLSVIRKANILRLYPNATEYTDQ